MFGSHHNSIFGDDDPFNDPFFTQPFGMMNNNNNNMMMSQANSIHRHMNNVMNNMMQQHNQMFNMVQQQSFNMLNSMPSQFQQQQQQYYLPSSQSQSQSQSYNNQYYPQQQQRYSGNDNRSSNVQIEELPSTPTTTHNNQQTSNEHTRYHVEEADDDNDSNNSNNNGNDNILPVRHTNTDQYGNTHSYTTRNQPTVYSYSSSQSIYMSSNGNNQQPIIKSKTIQSSNINGVTETKGQMYDSTRELNVQGISRGITQQQQSINAIQYKQGNQPVQQHVAFNNVPHSQQATFNQRWVSERNNVVNNNNRITSSSSNNNYQQRALSDNNANNTQRLLQSSSSNSSPVSTTSSNRRVTPSLPQFNPPNRNPIQQVGNPRTVQQAALPHRGASTGDTHTHKQRTDASTTYQPTRYTTGAYIQPSQSPNATASTDTNYIGSTTPPFTGKSFKLGNAK